jgi:hypothetical protein
VTSTTHVLEHIGSHTESLADKDGVGNELEIVRDYETAGNTMQRDVATTTTTGTVVVMRMEMTRRRFRRAHGDSRDFDCNWMWNLLWIVVVVASEHHHHRYQTEPIFVLVPPESNEA